MTRKNLSESINELIKFLVKYLAFFREMQLG